MSEGESNRERPSHRLNTCSLASHAEIKVKVNSTHFDRWHFCIFSLLVLFFLVVAYFTVVNFFFYLFFFFLNAMLDDCRFLLAFRWINFFVIVGLNCEPSRNYEFKFVVSNKRRYCWKENKVFEHFFRTISSLCFGTYSLT